MLVLQTCSHVLPCFHDVSVLFPETLRRPHVGPSHQDSWVHLQQTLSKMDGPTPKKAHIGGGPNGFPLPKMQKVGLASVLTWGLMYGVFIYLQEVLN